MPLILELPDHLEAELVAHWQRTGMIEGHVESSEIQEHMPETVSGVSHFRLPDALQTRLHDLLDRQDAGERLTSSERLEAEGLVEMADLLSLLHLRSLTTTRKN